MKKVWIKRESLFPKPFYKRKLFVFFVLLILCSIMFFVYQVKFINQLATSDVIATERLQQPPSKLTDHKPVEVAAPKREIIKGIRLRDIDYYTKKFPNQKFRCDGSREILFERINDDYCDCVDGKDETFTNACANGKFYCTHQMRHKTGRGQDVFVTSSRIRDGICDCRDCSDEDK